VKLAPNLVAPVFEWGFAYDLPGDCLRVLEVNGTAWPTDGWAVEGRQLVSNETAVELLYIYRNEDPNLYDAELVSALAAHLALELATSLSALPSIVDRAAERAKDALTEARRSDGHEEELVENPLESGWIAARFE
jgi:hypothetical protein